MSVSTFLIRAKLMMSGISRVSAVSNIRVGGAPFSVGVAVPAVRSQRSWPILSPSAGYFKIILLNRPGMRPVSTKIIGQEH